jgi:hypothetical protein
MMPFDVSNAMISWSNDTVAIVKDCVIFHDESLVQRWQRIQHFKASSASHSVSVEQE